MFYSMGKIGNMGTTCKNYRNTIEYIPYGIRSNPHWW